MAPELTTGLVLVLFAGLLSALTYITVRRSRETSDRDVAALQATDQRAEVSRKRLHEGIEDIRTHFVHKKECTQKHQQMSEQRKEFMAAALKLERVGERVNLTMQEAKAITQTQVAIQQDLSATMARVDEMRRDITDLAVRMERANGGRAE